MACLPASDRLWLPAALSAGAVSAGLLAGAEDGKTHDYLQSVSYLAMTVWAYEELVHGSNSFRRLLGLGYAVILTIRVAQAIRP
jgi:hypothetical protein